MDNKRVNELERRGEITTYEYKVSQLTNAVESENRLDNLAIALVRLQLTTIKKFNISLYYIFIETV
jgi:hypothetical protein